ncbi:HAD family hydrolase [Thermodesulfobacteriota bacterium]
MTEYNSIKAVIFDMDGLMLDSQRIATKAWKKAVSYYGYSLSDEDNLLMVGRNTRDSNEILRSLFGPDIPIDQFREYARQLFYDYVKDDGIPIKVGLKKLLDFLDEKKLPAAVATSTNRDDCIASLDKCGLTHRFKIIVCGDDVANGKPEPDLFLKASGLLQTAPESCIVLEDSFAGIRAAHAAGMIPIMVPDLIGPTEEIKSLAHIVVPSLNEAKLEIENLLRD